MVALRWSMKARVLQALEPIWKVVEDMSSVMLASLPGVLKTRRENADLGMRKISYATSC